MMTFNGGNRWVFPLVPTACSDAELNEYFGKLQNSEIEIMQMKGDFGSNLPVRKVTKEKSNDCESKWKVPNR